MADNRTDEQRRAEWERALQRRVGSSCAASEEFRRAAERMLRVEIEREWQLHDGWMRQHDHAKELRAAFDCQYRRVDRLIASLAAMDSAMTGEG